MDNELVFCFKWFVFLIVFVFEFVLDGVISFSYINMFFCFFIYSKILFEIYYFLFINKVIFLLFL